MHRLLKSVKGIVKDLKNGFVKIYCKATFFYFLRSPHP
jgi:hypothetical protein